MSLRIHFIFHILLLGWNASQVKAQEEVTVSLAFEQVVIPGLPYYVQEVIDARRNKASLGIASVGMLNKKVPIRFDIGFERSLMEYLRTIRPRDTLEQKPLILRIKLLNLKEIDDINARLGSAHIEADLIYRSEDRLVKLGEANFHIEQPAFNISKTHEARVRYLLYQCLSSLVKFEDRPGFTRSFEPFELGKLRSVEKSRSRLKSIEILGSGKRRTDFRQNGIPIGNFQIEQMIRDSGSQDALSFFKKSKRNMSIAALSSSLGGGLIGFTAGSYLAGGIFQAEALVAGGGGIGIGLLFGQLASSQIRRSVELYNEHIQNNRKGDLE